MIAPDERAHRAVGLGGGELAAAGLCVASLGAVGVGALAAGGASDAGLPCPFRAVTGLPCPFCGMTRSLLALGGGDPRESVSLHPLGPLLPLVAAAVLVACWRALRRGRPVRPPRSLVLVGASLLAIAWAVNLAGAGA